MRLSIGNQRRASAAEVRHGQVTTIVQVNTTESAEDVGLAAGDRVVVLINAPVRSC